MRRMELHDHPVALIDLLETPARELPELPSPDVHNPVIEAYKKDVDRTLLIDNLRLTSDQRSQKFQSFMGLAYEVRHRGERMRTSKPAEERQKIEKGESS